MLQNIQSPKLLIVDDEPVISDIIFQCLSGEGYACDTANSAEQALTLLEQIDYHLIISDIMMPGKSGIELLEEVKKKHPDIAIIMVTAVDDRKTAVRALQLGAYGYVIKPFELNEIVLSTVNALERRRLSLESKKYEARLENDVRERTQEIHQREEEICLRLTSACEFRDEETGTHIRRIGLYSAVIGAALGWEKRTLDEIQIAACMHDIGKIGVPDNVLQKPGRLTPEEFEIIKTHPSIGAQILSGSDISLINMAKDIALSHHEKWNGSGYPKGLVGEDIPETARIVAIVDVYDALVYKRVYRPAIPEEEALDMMRKDVGTHFDPRLFDIFIKVLPQIRDIRMRVREENE